MLEVLYRIYEVADEDTVTKRLSEDGWANNIGGFGSISKLQNIELVYDCLICESREHFKEIIRDTYGKDIKFAYNRHLVVGSLYCVIIGEHCYNTEQYFDKKEYECAHCHSKVQTYRDKPILVSDYELTHELYNISAYANKRFCSNQCKNAFIRIEQQKVRPDSDTEFWITPKMFEHNGVIGYVYKITRKSTGEFYVGQTSNVPVFRWGQHLKTDRFPLDKIEDYLFEVLEVVGTETDLLSREAYWIKKCAAEQPGKTLNIVHAPK